MSQIPHFISTEPFDAEATTAAGSVVSERHAKASQARLIWWRFLRHKVAVVSLAFLAVSYAAILFVEFLAPYELNSRHTDFIFAPPQPVHLFHDGSFVGPFVYPLNYTLDMETLRRTYDEDRTQPLPIRFFCKSEPYSFWGLFSAETHLVCPPEGGTLFLLGTDRLGRDMLSRIVYGARISLTIGLVGVTLSFIIGITIGGLAGYFGGWVDATVQRVTEVLRSIPELPLWLALSAALPLTWSPLLVYFGITLILALLDWPGLARAVRSKLFALREEDFVAAAEMLGASPRRIIFRHLLPNFMSHLIASASLSIPTMILAETALSFLGLGLRPPITSWGVLLSEAQNIEAVALYPWLLLPMLPVVLVVLAFSFVGDGLRDAVDPYQH
ncbi:ABC transporter permease [Jiella pacifica]|uniref:ABC transporter permease subunit n=1 Tax=Jiella pacifica TaxID=2696469 RepID=A0A6N9T3J2_9HYPH|nr:ABC transporter permease [Jiella pacifica]NDW04616.1 ABC transporter permease subunit [Jiella pacifica]